MIRLPSAFISFAIFASALSSSTLAAESTATYPVGSAPCGGVEPACEPAQDFLVTTDGVLRAEVTVSFTCIATTVYFSVDGGAPVASAPVPVSGSTGVVELGPVTPGTHTLTVAADVPLGLDCDTRGWIGSLAVTTAGIGAADAALVPPGGDGTVSTLVAGSPRPAGITATLYRAASAATSARIGVATYAGLPLGLAGPPIRAAGYLDLQLTDGVADDVIAGQFFPNDPVFPTDPTLPPNPIIPTDPLLPPNPIRLAWWNGAAWSPVSGSHGALPTYSSAANRFSVTLDATSAPSVTALGGTVFAAIPNYYYRGFGIPVDAGTLNVAKAGRAIPLKWQVFDATAAPVLDLDPAVVKVSSVAIACAGASQPTDAVEEYAAGASGLQNNGDGNYQLNWATAKSYAGSCRRVRLDLGERNPEGTVFYRTADFKFTR